MTLEQLSNLSDEELNRLAAERVMGWREIVSRIDPIGAVAVPCHLWEGERPGNGLPFSHWEPATDYNQSRDLLAGLVGRGAEFETHWSKKQPRILYRTGKVTPERIWDGASPGVSARSETIAALLAWQALESGKTNPEKP